MTRRNIGGMRTYLRNRVPGGTYFFTVNLAERHGNTLLADRIVALKQAFITTQATWPFEMIAMVVLPEHLHAIWRLPEGDTDYSTRWRLIKGRFAHAIECGEKNPSRRRSNERGIWQRRYWEHTIRDEADLHSHIDYIHFNPVKHGLCQGPTEWPYSTLHKLIKQGDLPPDWAVKPRNATSSSIE